MTELLERNAEPDRLAALLADARRGHGRVAFVCGEPGIGKSSLVAALVGTARGTRVAIGRCDALATPRPLGSFRDAVAGLGGVDTVDDRDGLLGVVLDAVRGDEPVVLAAPCAAPRQRRTTGP